MEQRLKELQSQLTAAQQQAEGADARAGDLQQQLAHHKEQAEQQWKQLQLEVSGVQWKGGGALAADTIQLAAAAAEGVHPKLL